MPTNNPIRRTCRQFTSGVYTKDGHWKYIYHPEFAKNPRHYVRAFLLLQKDLKELFQYIEPADKNLNCYSFRTHSLLFRACVEIEANCKAILRENGYHKNNNFNIKDYFKINHSHLLSNYNVKIPIWKGQKSLRVPFNKWKGGYNRLPWYQAYNSSKHDRQNEFESATFEHMLDAICGVFVLLSAQFHIFDFSPESECLEIETNQYWSDEMESGIGDFFRVKFPDNFPDYLQYDFNWQNIKNCDNPFNEFDYNNI